MTPEEPVSGPHAFEAHSIEGGAVDSMGMLQSKALSLQRDSGIMLRAFFQAPFSA